MKKILLFILLEFLCTAGFSQSYFEGEIIYANRFISKISNLTSAQFETLIGGNQEYFIKGGDYKSYSNGKSINFQLYHSSSNRIYNKTPQSDTLYWFDASNNTNEIVSSEIEKKKEVILGIMCDALILRTKHDVTTFYYNSKYKVNAELYSKHQYGNWYYMLTKTGAIPLKSVIESRQFIMVSTATAIKPMNLGDNYFSIGSGTPLKRSK